MSGDIYWANVVLLVSANGTDGATTFVDESPAARTLTAVGNAQIDTAQFKFGVSSALFDGTGDAITAPDSPDWDLSNANSDQFTVELWVRFNTLTEQTFIGQWVSGQLAWHIRRRLADGHLQFAWSVDKSATQLVVTAGATVVVNTWYHVAVDKDATGKIRVYIDGVMRGSATPANSTIGDSTSALTIGAENSGSTRVVNGWLDELRITKGVARYASDAGFAVPTTAFPRGVFVAGRANVWTGSAWAIKPAKVWSGSAWVEKPVKVWNGSAWV